MELLDPESSQIKEVYTYFGLAMYWAQCLEKTLAIALATAYGPGPTRITRSQYDALLESNFQKTLGQLIYKMREAVTISDDLEHTLSKALEKRNWLAHRYFWDKAVTFMTEDGRQTMIQELNLVVDFFQDLDSRFMTIVRQFTEKLGVTEELLNELAKRLLDNK